MIQKIPMPDGSSVVVNVKPGQFLTEQDKREIAAYVLAKRKEAEQPKRSDSLLHLPSIRRHAMPLKTKEPAK